jgi:alpha-L-rhamnosidase
MVGWVRLKVSGPAGTVITLRHAEVLDQKGNMYLDNLRSAKQLIQYTLKGKGIEEFEPRFTFMGFQYVRIEGMVGQPNLETLTGIVVHSDIPSTGEFECSNPMINQLQHNIVLGQKGNFVDVPTDCPQRDERLG